MSRRTLLSAEQRTRLFAIPIDPAEMARYYMLSAEDLALIRAKRRVTNRLGFAIQLCSLRYPGWGLSPSELPPAPMLTFVARQLRIDPARFEDYAHRAEARREHMIELCSSAFAASDWPSGAHASRWARTRHGPRTAASRSFGQCSSICAPQTVRLSKSGHDIRQQLERSGHARRK